MDVYAFWNNKGGTGKTSLAFQTICSYANQNPDERILALDLCPQANFSELMLGGLVQDGSANLLKRQGEIPRATIAGYFQTRLSAPYTPPTDISPDLFTTIPSDYNSAIPSNIDMICGDPLLELQANAVSTLANTSLPTLNTWVAVVDWLSDFLEPIQDSYDVAFIDTNPSFSIYTQVAIAAADRLIMPVMADDSSRRAIQNAFSLVYGLRLPSEIYAQYAFATKLQEAGRELPKVRLIAKNRITQYMGSASAYGAVLRSIDRLVSELVTSNPHIFTFDDVSDGIVDIRDFQTTGVVAFARGCPFYELQPGRLEVAGRRVQVNRDNIENCTNAIQTIVNHISLDQILG